MNHELTRNEEPRLGVSSKAEESVRVRRGFNFRDMGVPLRIEPRKLHEMRDSVRALVTWRRLSGLLFRPSANVAEA